MHFFQAKEASMLSRPDKQIGWFGYLASGAWEEHGKVSVKLGQPGCHVNPWQVDRGSVEWLRCPPMMTTGNGRAWPRKADQTALQRGPRDKLLRIGGEIHVCFTLQHFYKSIWGIVLTCLPFGVTTHTMTLHLCNAQSSIIISDQQHQYLYSQSTLMEVDASIIRSDVIARFQTVQRYVELSSCKFDWIQWNLKMTPGPFFC